MTTVQTLGIYDEVGRYLGPAEVTIQLRPMGPWDTNVAPRAVFAYTQPDWDNGPGFSMYHIVGGPSDRSTVSAATLQGLGIAVPDQAAA